jgi:FtsP/CotA-like multicopper oxidase with cupredoxin domain
MDTKWVSFVHRKALIVVAFVASISACGFAQTSFPPPGVAPLPNPCPRLSAGSAVFNPSALFSSNGILNVDFSYQTTTDSAGRTLFCFMTPNGLENPTLHLMPGDRLVITVTNNTPAGMNPMVLNSPNCGARTMDSSSMNIHYHGTNTSPVCGQDEVIKTVVNSGQTFQYNVAFPANEPPGLYWYHPHIHGIAEAAVLGGASGAIVIEGINDAQPAVAGLRQQIFVIRDQPQLAGLNEGPGGCVNGVPYQDLSVNFVPIDSYQANPPNGRVTFTPAVLNVNPGEKQFWRVTNSSADSILDLQLQYDRVPQTLVLVAIDGVPVNSQDGTQPASMIPVTHFRLPPASRVEFVVTTPWPAVRSAQLVTTSINTGANGDCDPNRPILNIALGGDATSSDSILPRSSARTNTWQRFNGLGTAPIARQRLVYFDENSDQTQFYMVVAGQPEAVFNPDAPPAITATQGTVEQWTVENHALENHEFHIHQIHFLVQSQNHYEINGEPQAPAIDGQYLDMVEVPGWDGIPQHPYPSVKLLLDFRGQDIGTFVFHCHILGHEDLGMMNIIQVVPPSAVWNEGQLKALPDAKNGSPGPAPSAAPTEMPMTMPASHTASRSGGGKD